MIEIIFRFTPEYNQVVTVQPDGFIPLQEVEEIKIAGLTVTEATVAILARYANVLNEPVVTVALKDFAKPFFAVGGEVARPGRFDLRGDVTMSDAIAMAGGFGLGAKTSEVLLLRRVSKEVAEVRRINIKNTLAKGLLAEDVILQPGDSIYVPKSRAGKVERFMSISRLGAYFPIPY